MNRDEIEKSILGMEDVGTVLLMMDRSFVGRDPEPEAVERAFYILKSVFEQRYMALSVAFYGGGAHA